MLKSDEMWKKLICGTISKEEAISEYMELGYSREYAETGYSELTTDIHKARGFV
jgi:hypothetical protein